MVKLFYNIGIYFYTLGIRIASLFHPKARLWIKGRKGLMKKIRQWNRTDETIIWFHAASLGEFEQGRPVMEALKESNPSIKILLTFFSPSGYEIRKNYPGADYILYLPPDFPKNAKLFINHIQPDVAVFIKYEFWYNYLNNLHKKRIPTYLISGIFRKEQPFFQYWGGLHRKMLSFFTWIFVQDVESVSLLETIGQKNIELAGDTRFDRVKQIADAAIELEKIDCFCEGKTTIICGSTWPADEDILFEYINNSTGYKWIIAPHEINESHLQTIQEKCRKNYIRYSNEKSDLQSAEVLIVDCIGLLSSIYRYGQIAYIGGGFGNGIHNTLEAAVYNIPVIFGPKYQKFHEAVSLIKNKGAFSIKSKEELCSVLDSLLNDQTVRQLSGMKAGEYVNRQLGATRKIIGKLAKEIDQ